MIRSRPCRSLSSAVRTLPTLQRVVMIGLTLVCAHGQDDAAKPQGATWVCSVEDHTWVDRSRDLKITGDAGTTLHIDPTKIGQTIDGFGGCFNELGWQVMSILSENARTEILKQLFADDGCAFTLARMPIGASDYALDYYSLDDVAGDLALEHFSIDRDRKLLLPFIKAAMTIRPQLQVWGSAWTPPAWMKDSRRYNGGMLTWDDVTRRAYAHYLAKAAKAYRQEGLNFYAVHVQNEPASNQIFPSCIWTGERLRDFIREDLGPVFKAEKLDAEIWLGTINDGDYGKFLAPTLTDPIARATISGVGLQWAGKGALTTVHARFPQVKLMQTETECGNGDNNWAYGEYTFGLMKRYFNGGVSSYMQWNMVLDESGTARGGGSRTP